jgi:hypothetical protein
MDQTKTKGESLLPPATVNNSTTPTSKGESLFKFDNMLDDLNDECFNSKKKQQLLLGIYSLDTIIHYMDEFKIGKCLEMQGIKEYYFELDTSDWYIHKFYLWMGQKDVTPKDESHLLAEMWFRRVQNIHQVRGIADVAYSDHRAATKRREHASITQNTTRNTEDNIPEIYHSHDNYLLINAAPLLKSTFLKLEHIDFIVVEWTRMQNPTVSPYNYHTNIKHEKILMNIPPSSLTSNNKESNALDINTTNNNNTNKTTDSIDNNTNTNNNTDNTTNNNNTNTNTNNTTTTTTNNNNNNNLTKVEEAKTCVDPFLLLPGQNYPSLGIGRIIDKVLFKISMDDKKDGILNVPLYFHNAVFYQKENYHFVNPIFEGIYETMYRDLLPWIKEKGLGYVAHGLLRGLVKAWVTFEYVEIISKDDEEEELSIVEGHTGNEDIIMDKDNKIGNEEEGNEEGINSNNNYNNNNNEEEEEEEENEFSDEQNRPVRVEFENGIPIPVRHRSRSRSPTSQRTASSPESDLTKSFEDNDDIRSFKSDFDSGDEDNIHAKSKSKKIVYQLPKKNNRPYATVRWKGLDMMYPISQTMKNFYNSKNYKKLKQEYCGSGVFWIDSETNSLLTEKDWQMAVYANDVDTRPTSQLKFK